MILHPDCDVDYSSDSYVIYEHEVVAKNQLKLTKRMVFQEQGKPSVNEEENIDHEESKITFITILPSGIIKE